MFRPPQLRAVWGRVAIAAALLVAVPGVARAQFERASISGTVTDQQGGVVPGVTVTAVQVATQQSRTAVTDASGFYTIASLMPGKYDISVELDGFKKATRTAVQLDAAASATLEFTLETGALTEAVTVTAEAPPLQTDVAIRKTVEAKDIEQLSFSGRNPIGVAGLKAGVIGGSFNNYGFAAFSNGGFNINGSRADENNITVDGAIAIRTRSSGAIIGIQNVDAIQEVQVLTANYMPEYGRASGGQIRFVTKSGSNRYSGQRVVLPARRVAAGQHLGPQPQHQRGFENRGPAPFDYKQYGYSFGGPIPRSMIEGQAVLLRRAGVGELLPGPDQHRHGADRSDAPRRLQRAARSEQRLLHAAAVIIDPQTGQPFPGNIIPTQPAVGERPRDPERVSAADARLPAGHPNLIQTSANPQDQRKDNIRFDYRLNATNQFTYRYSGYAFTGWTRSGGDFPFARRSSIGRTTRRRRAGRARSRAT